MSEFGHNSGSHARDTREAQSQHPSAAQIQSFVTRIERLHEEKKTIEDDIKTVYAEAAGNGFDKKVIREVVKLRRVDRSERSEFDSLVELYLAACEA